MRAVSAATGSSTGSVTCRTLQNPGEKISPNLPSWWVKKCCSLLFSKYEMHKGWHLYRIHKKGEYTSVPGGKKNSKYFINQPA